MAARRAALTYTSLCLGDLQMVMLRRDPCIRLVKNFLSQEHCTYIISKYDNTVERSTVSEGGDSDAATSSERTSYTAFLPPGEEDPVIDVIEKRCELLTGREIEYWETLQLTRYGPGQEYKPHFDYFSETESNRTITIFVYLNTVPSGGGTYFPRLDLRIQPVLGTAIIWYNCILEGNNIFCDDRTEHSGEPVIRDKKYGMNAWARSKRFR